MDVSGYSVEELEKQYSPSAWCKRMSPSIAVDEHIRIITAACQTVEEKLICQKNLSYGQSDRQKLDIFSNASTPRDAPILVYIHGGYWQLLSKNEYSFIALPIVEAGGIFISVGYDLAPSVSVTEIVSQIQEAIRYILNLALVSNSRGVYLSGHSAGGQLSAMCLSIDWTSRLGVSCNHLIKGVIPISGVFDLCPLVQTSMNDQLSLTKEEAWAISPMNSKNYSVLCSFYKHCQVFVVVGENDSPEFRKQSLRYHTILKDQGMPTKFIDVPEVDHFDVVEKLLDPSYNVMQEIIQLMGLHGSTTNA